VPDADGEADGLKDCDSAGSTKSFGAGVAPGADDDGLGVSGPDDDLPGTVTVATACE
jgi:hypothetical protein